MTTPPTPAGLGRRFVEHDPRSRAFPVRTALAAVPVERKPTVWALPRTFADGPFPLNQGGEGACTGYGLAHELAAGPVVARGVNAAYAERRYQRARQVDAADGHRFPDGATTLAAVKAAKADGLITGYRWAFGIGDVVDTLCTFGPVCLGLSWYDGMYATRPDGLVVRSGPLVGGHFITAIGYDIHPTAGPCVLWLNTWGSSYGVGDGRVGVDGGVGWVPVATLADLLADDGEAVVPADFLAPPDPLPAEPAAPAPGKCGPLAKWIGDLFRRNHRTR